MNFSQVNSPYWDKQTAYIIGGGPSLKDFDFSKLNGLTIGVNDSAFKAKTQVLFSIDKTWIHHRIDEIRAFKGEKYLAVPYNYTPESYYFVEDAIYLVRRRGPGMTNNPKDIQATNSGFGAINLCYHKKTRTIVMLGFDMCVDSEKTHWHGGYNWQRSQNDKLYAGWLNDFDIAARQLVQAGIKAYNVTSGSSLINSFPRVELESMLDIN